MISESEQSEAKRELNHTLLNTYSDTSSYVTLFRSTTNLLVPTCNQLLKHLLL